MPEINRQKLFWHSRRGMLELDLLLVPFTMEVFASLGADEQCLYQDFLACEDQDLYQWLVQGHAPPEARFKPLIDRIRAHKAANHP